MIIIKDLTKTFDNNKIFDHFNCSIDDNEMVAFVGESGKGKSTLLNIIGALDTKYDGEVFVNDTNLGGLSRAKRQKFIRDNISYLFQNYALIEDETVLENLLLALEYVKCSRREKIDKIKETLVKFGIDDLMTEKVYTLSGGEQQRVSLARTMLKPCSIVLADEPTGNLDIKNRDEIINILRSINKEEKIVVIVTHDNVVAKKCDRIINI